MKTAALELATRFRVFPLWPVLPANHADGFICGCGALSCDSPGKHPLGKLAKRGCKDATQEPARVRWLWDAAPNANIGIATGDGTVVLDIDPRHGGGKSIAELQRKHGRLPETLTSRTGGGGWHAYFAGNLPNSAGSLGPGIDTRGDGGFVVAPPSLHVSGRRYEWLSQTPIAPLPDWIAGELGKQRKQAAAPGHWRSVITTDVAEGCRDVRIAQITGHLLERDVDSIAVLDIMRCWNACHCKPPLTDDQVIKVVRSICARELAKRVSDVRPNN